MPRLFLKANIHKFLAVQHLSGGLREARLALCDAIRQALAQGLELLGIDAPDEM